MKKLVSIVIPCYRSETMIAGVVADIDREMEKLKDRYAYEIILVNDCSPDATFEAIRGLCREKPYITGVNLARNFGQHAALMAGFRQIKGELLVCLDDDGQTPAAAIGDLLQGLEEGADVVYAKYEHKHHNAFRNFGSRINDWMLCFMLGKPKDLYVSSYFAARRFIIDEIISYQNPYPYVIGLVLRSTKNIVNVRVDHREREEGTSGYTMKKLLSLWFNGFTAFSVKPLRVATVVGMLFAAAGFLYLVYTLVNRFINPNVPIGWSSMMAVLLVVGGCILFMLGLIGEYIGRIYISLNNSPQFVIKKVTGGKDEQK